VTDERLRVTGNNGVQLPVKEFKDGKLIGTEMVYADYKFSTTESSTPLYGAPRIARKRLLCG
jgi:arsenite oxidase large subunit